MSTTQIAENQLNWAYTVIIIMCSLSTFITCLAMFVTFLFRERPSFLFSQPSFLGVLLLGLLLVQLSLFFLATSQKDAAIFSGSSNSCQAYLWCFWIGSSLALSAQCARLYRALLVFRQRTLRRPNMNTTKFFLSLAALCMIPISLVMIRLLTDPVKISQGVCLPLEVASNPNSVVFGLLVRLSVWGLLGVCFWFTRTLEKLGATVDDAKTQGKLFLWIFSVDAVLSVMQSQGLPTDHVAILLSSATAFGSIAGLHAVFSLKLARIGLTGKEMLIALRREKENRELNAMTWKRSPPCRCSRHPLEWCRSNIKDQLLANPQAGQHPPSSRAPRISFDVTDDGERHDPVFLSDAILASMTSRPVSRVSLRHNRFSAPANVSASFEGPVVQFTPTDSGPRRLVSNEAPVQFVAPDTPRRIHMAESIPNSSNPPTRNAESSANDVILASIN